MKQGIVICSHINFNGQLNNCVAQLSDTKYPIYYIINGNATKLRINNLLLLDADNFELGAIREAINTFDLDEFILIQDTIEIKDTKLFDIAFDDYNNKSVYFLNRWMCYFGKYRKEILNKLTIPVIDNKRDSIMYEDVFNREYMKLDNSSVCVFPGLDDIHNFEEKFGRNNMIIENEYFKKYKGTWNWDMIND